MKNIEIPQEILKEIKNLGEATKKEIDEKIIKITRQTDKTVLRLGTDTIYINTPTQNIDNKRVR